MHINTKDIVALDKQLRPDTRVKQPDDVMHRLPTCDTQRELPVSKLSTCIELLLKDMQLYIIVSFVS